MFIQRPDTKSRTMDRLVRWFRKRSGWISVMAIAAGFLLYSLLLYSYGVWVTLAPQISVAAQTMPQSRGGKNRFDPSVSRPERLEIGISGQDMQKLVSKRQEALAAGILVTSGDDYVPAKIRQGGQVHQAKIRLKGDWTAHLEGRKWSFRVSLKGEDALLGMREFSIQHPAQRNFIFDWLFQQVLSGEGIIALRGQLVDVALNNQELGLYYLEEHFDKILVESNRFREGPIIKFNEDLLWADRHRGFGPTDPDAAFQASAIDAFQQNQIDKNPQLRENFKKAFNLLYHFRTGQLPADQVFDLEKMARYYAVSDLLGAYHMAFFHNLRFYYNPITSLLEPVAFDSDAGNRILDLLSSHQFTESAFYDFDRLLFSHPGFMKRYLAQLARVSAPSYLEAKLSEISGDMKVFLNILYQEFPDYVFPKENILYNQKYIQQALQPIKGLHAYLKGTADGGLILRSGNIQPLPVEVLGIEYQGRVAFRAPRPVLLAGKDPVQSVDYQDLVFKPVGEFSLTSEQWKDARLVYQVQATDLVQRAEIFPWEYYQERFRETDFILRQPNAEKFDFLKIDAANKTITVKRGTWVLTESLIIPPGYTVGAGAGTTLDLRAGAVLLSYSPLHWIGEEGNPVTIESSDGTGQGVAVLKAGARSIWEHVLVRNLSNPKQEGWELTGAVTFYESDVELRQCQLMLNRDGDDLLNIVRSEFVIEDSQFSQAFLDAIDFDFAKGRLTKVSFVKSGNDAMDFSGTVAEVQGITIDQAMDKGLSVGEGSQVTANNIIIKNSQNGLVSKDTSTLDATDVTLDNCRIGLAAYQKKPEFGPARIKVQRFRPQNVQKLFAQQDGSQIIVFYKD